MKKVCIVLCIVVLLVSCVLSFTVAETATLKAGEYSVGVDLPAGDYEITCTKVTNYYTSYMDSLQSLAGDDPDLSALFGLYGSLTDTMEASVNIKGTYGENKGSFSLKENGKKKVSLKNDWVIALEDGEFSFELLNTAVEESVSSSNDLKETKSPNIQLGINLDQYSDEEILALSALVNQEIVSRRINKSAKVPAGDYIVGVDIPAGKYYVEKITDEKYSHAVVYEDKTKIVKLTYITMNDDTTGFITMENGNLLSIGSDMLLTIYTGVTFN